MCTGLMKCQACQIGYTHADVERWRVAYDRLKARARMRQGPLGVRGAQPARDESAPARKDVEPMSKVDRPERRAPGVSGHIAPGCVEEWARKSR